MRPRGLAIASALSAPASIASARPSRANVPMACVTHRLERSCIIFLCSDPASAGVLGGLTFSTFNVPLRLEIRWLQRTDVADRRRSHRPTKAVNPGTFFPGNGPAGFLYKDAVLRRAAER